MNVYEIANRAAEIHSMHATLVNVRADVASPVLHLTAVRMWDQGFRPGDFITPSVSTVGVTDAFIASSRDEIHMEAEVG